MHTIEKSVEVNVPVRTAYDQWTQFESFPQFMENVEQVEQLDDKRLHWVASVGGKRKEWDAEIVEQVPDELISWRSTSGPLNNGTVSFRQVGGDRCKITLIMTYEPEGGLEKLGDMLGVLSAQVSADLRRFKEFIESRKVETGGWRGTIHNGEVQKGQTAQSGSTGMTGYGGMGSSGTGKLGGQAQSGGSQSTTGLGGTSGGGSGSNPGSGGTSSYRDPKSGKY